MSCVEVCPVDAIHPTPQEPGFSTCEQLYIDPEVCIDCDACFDACPVSAIYPVEAVPSSHQESIAINAEFFATSETT
jgi:ferredoxin--NADP+ reductase